MDIKAFANRPRVVASSGSRIPHPIKTRSCIPVKIPVTAKSPRQRSSLLNKPGLNRNVIKPIVTKKLPQSSKGFPVRKNGNTIASGRKSIGKMNTLRTKNVLKQTTIPKNFFKCVERYDKEANIDKEALEGKEKENASPSSVVPHSSDGMTAEQFRIQLNSEFENSEFYRNQILSNECITYAEAQKLPPVVQAFPDMRSTISAVRNKPMKGSMSCNKLLHRPMSLAERVLPLSARRGTWAPGSPLTPGLSKFSKNVADPFEVAMAGIRRLTLMKQLTSSTQKTPESSKKLDAFQIAMQQVTAMKARKARRHLDFSKDVKNLNQGPDYRNEKVRTLISGQCDTVQKKRVHFAEDEASGPRSVNFLESVESVPVKISSSIYRPLKTIFEQSSFKQSLTDIFERSGEGTCPSTPNVATPLPFSSSKEQPLPKATTDLPSTAETKMYGSAFSKGDIFTLTNSSAAIHTPTPVRYTAARHRGKVPLFGGGTKTVRCHDSPICSPLVKKDLFDDSEISMAEFLGIDGDLDDCVTDAKAPPGRCNRKRKTDDQLADEECFSLTNKQWCPFGESRPLLNPVAFMLNDMDTMKFIPIGLGP